MKETITIEKEVYEAVLRNSVKVADLEAENQRLKKVERKKGALVNENYKLKKLLKECGRQLEEVELCRYDVADVDQEDWFRISTEQAGIAKKMKTKINEALK